MTVSAMTTGLGTTVIKVGVVLFNMYHTYLMRCASQDTSHLIILT